MKCCSSLDSTHEALLTQIISQFSQDPRIAGIGASGSYAPDSMDKYSDLDRVIAITQMTSMLSSRSALRSSIR